MTNAFRLPTGELDRIYLRAMAIYRLFKHGHVTTTQAKDLADRQIPGIPKGRGWLHNTIEIWAKALKRAYINTLDLPENIDA